MLTHPNAFCSPGSALPPWRCSSWALAPVLSPFIAAGVLAGALSPSVDWLAWRRVPRMVAVGLVETAALIALLAVLLLVLPILNKELPALRTGPGLAKA